MRTEALSFLCQTPTARREGIEPSRREFWRLPGLRDLRRMSFLAPSRTLGPFIRFNLSSCFLRFVGTGERDVWSRRDSNPQHRDSKSDNHRLSARHRAKRATTG